MDIVVSHKSALQLLRSPQAVKWTACSSELPARMPSPEDLREACLLFPQLGDMPDVLIAEKNGGHSGKYARVHVWTSALPQGALVQVAPGIRCVSPLLLPVLLAAKHSTLEMALLLSELMGLYAICEDSAMGLIQRRAPLAAAAELESFLAMLDGAWGSGAVKRALRIAPAMSASPLEAKLYLRVTLPHAKGGYNLGEVVLNDPQEMRRLAFGGNAGRRRKPDLLFKGRDHGGVCLDYMGAWHDSDSQVRRDTQRRNELLANGFTPYEIYKDQYDDLDYMDELMASIRKDLGLPPIMVSREAWLRRRRARHELWRQLEHISF